MSWHNCKLKDISIIGDGAHASIKRLEQGILYLSSKNLGINGLNLSKVDYISESDYNKYFKSESKALTKPRVGDILLGIIGTLGAPYLVKEDDFFGLSSSVSIIRPDTEKVISSYVYYWLKSPIFQSAINQTKSGVAQSFLSLSVIGSLPLFYPESITIQKKIVNILSSYDNLIENNRRRIQLLEESARLLYREWFVHLRFPSHEHSKIVDGVPDGWERLSVKDCCSKVSYGYTASASQENIGSKFLRITDIVPSTISWDSVPFCEIDDSNKAKYLLEEGDIVVARTGATVGYAKRIHKLDFDVVYASYLVRFKPNRDIIDDLILGIYMESNEFKHFVKSNAGGAAQPNANAQVLGAAKILVPPLNIQKLFREYSYDITLQNQVLEKQISALVKARDLLLPRLMNGEITV